jgi:hypothetical protein
VYDDLEAVYKALKLEKGLQAPYQVPALALTREGAHDQLVLTSGVATFQSKNNGLEYLKIALEKRVDEQTLLKPGDMSPGEIAARGLYTIDPRHSLPLFVFAHLVPHTIQDEP